MADKQEKDSDSTNIERASPKTRRLGEGEVKEKIGLLDFCAIRSRKYTAHHFKEYRKKRGMLIRAMRQRRRMPQAALGAPSQIRLYESGKAAQIGTQEILARLVPCPREILKLLQNELEHLPVACVECRANCKYKGLDEKAMIATFCEDITYPPKE